MKSGREAIFGLSLITIIILTLPARVRSAGKVLDIGDKLPELLEKHPDKNWLIEFYAPWCHHCQQLEPTYNEVAERIYHNHDQLIVGRIDCTKYSRPCEDYRIDSYPTIMFISNNHRTKYKGDRSEDAIVAFAERLNGPSVNMINSCDQLKTALERHEIIILSTLNASSNLRSVFESLAQSHKSDYWFYQLPSSSHRDCHWYNLYEEGLYILKKNLNRAIRYETSKMRTGEEKSISESEGHSKQILNWIVKESFPIFRQIGSRNIERSLATGKIIVLALLDEYKPARRLAPSSYEFKKYFEKLAVKYAQEEINYNKFLFGWSSDLDLIEYIIVSPVKTLPNIIIINADFSYYLMVQAAVHDENDENKEIRDELSEQNIANVITKLRSGTLNFSGGNSYLYTILRFTLGNINKFISMYRANPLLVLLIFGFPTAILIFVIYTTCCYEENYEEKTEQIYSDDDEELERYDEERRQRQQPLSNGHLKQD